jgi:hypothetical protein
VEIGVVMIVWIKIIIWVISKAGAKSGDRKGGWSEWRKRCMG